MKKSKAVKPSGRSQYISFAQSVLNITGAALAIHLWGGSVDAYPLRSWAEAAILTGVVTILALFIFQSRWTRLIGSISFMINIIPVYGLVWFANAGMSEMKTVWVPFESNRLSALTVAILAPTRIWIGVVCILGFVVQAVVQLHGFSSEAMNYIPRSEPNATIAYGAFALILFFYRVASRAQERKTVRSREQASMMKRLSKIILALRDLANTPVQTLTVDAALLRRNHPGAEFLAGRIEMSAAKLKKLNRLLVAEANGHKHNSTEASLDSRDILDSLKTDQ